MRTPCLPPRAWVVLALLLPGGTGKGQSPPPPNAPVRRATLVELRDGAEQPGTVLALVWVMDIHSCGRCPPRHLCQPCGTLTSVADTRSAAPDDWMMVPDESGMRKGRGYRIWLRLDKGYREQLRSARSDPRTWRIHVLAADRGDRAPTGPPPAPTPMRRIAAGRVAVEGAEPVPVQGFSLDETEVTAAQYELCIESLGCLPPGELAPGCNLWRPDRRDHPMNCLTPAAAEAFCTWAGKRLPDESEWMLAAVGAEGRRYPWGNAPISSRRANLCGRECTTVLWREQRLRRTPLYPERDRWPETAPVGSLPDGATPDGVLDLAGNVSEITAPHPSCREQDADSESLDPEIPFLEHCKAIARGGSWGALTEASAGAAARQVVATWSASREIGFRCAR